MKLFKFKFLNGGFRSEPIIFNSEEVKLITIERDVYCYVIIDDNLLSIVHCTILYKIRIGWFIRDGKININDNNF